jgi:hypothetical protein
MTKACLQGWPVGVGANHHNNKEEMKMKRMVLLLACAAVFLGASGRALADCPDMVLYCEYYPRGSKVIKVGTCADTWGNCGASNCGYGRGTCDSYIQSCADQAGVPVSDVCYVRQNTQNDPGCRGPSASKCGR